MGAGIAIAIGVVMAITAVAAIVMACCKWYKQRQMEN